MADEFGDYCEGCAAHEVVGDESVSQIIDFGVLNPGEFEVPVDSRPDISDKQRPAGFSDE